MRWYLILLSLLIGSSTFSQHRLITTTYSSDSTKVRERYHCLIQGSDTIKDGWYEIFHFNGSLWQKGKFKMGLLDSTWHDYFDNGKMKQFLPYQSGKLEGEALIFYEDGGLKEKIQYVNDLPHGTVELYYPDGNLQEITGYKSGLRDGKSKGYHQDGKIWFLKNFIQGIEHGRGEEYYPNGKIKEYYLKKFGRLDSIFTSYYKDYEDGTVYAHIPYNMGIISGRLMSYYPDGCLKEITSYVNDVKHGNFTAYYDDPEKIKNELAVKELGQYQKGHRDGLWKSYYFIDGTLKSEGRYSTANRFEGDWKVYYPNGKLKQLGSFIDGKAEGEFLIYYDNGNLNMRGSYENDLKVGLWQAYYDDGKLLSEIHFFEGRRHGTAKAFNQAGKVVEERLYKLGNIISESYQND